MNALSLLDLPEYLLNYSLSFCHPKDIYLSFNLLCKFLHQFISKSKYLSLHIALNSFGISLESLKSFSGLSDFDLIEIFFTKLQNLDKIKYIDIPFYGFYTDGGIDNNSPKFWIDTLFIKGDWSICTRAGNNFHIKGALCENFQKVKNGLTLFNEINRDLKKYFFSTRSGFENLENDELFTKLRSKILINGLKKEIKSFNLRNKEKPDPEDSEISFDETCPKKKKNIKKVNKKNKRKIENFTLVDTIFNEINKNDSDSYYRGLSQKELLENISISMNVLSKNEIKWKKIKESNEYEIFDDKIMVNPTKYAIIKGFEISRRGVFTCPVKTCMVFISDFDIDIKKTEIFGLFKEAKNIEEIKRIFDSYGEDLPSIYSTNCPELKDKSENKTKPSACPCAIAQFIIFNNNERKLSKEIKPIAWLHFENYDLKELQVKLDKFRLFSGRYIVVKLIDCDNRMSEFGDPNEETNIDINYISFFGEFFDLKNPFLAFT